MSNFELDPNQGPHAASGLSDDELEYLHRIISLEMAIRMNEESYEKHFHNVAKARKEMDEMIQKLREDRERMCFVAAVQADIDSLPLTTDDDSDDQSYGLYL